MLITIVFSILFHLKYAIFKFIPVLHERFILKEKALQN